VTGYTETFRGEVRPWETDATEHFTVAFYFEKFEAATWRFLRAAGVDPAAARVTTALAHYKSELRVRDIFRIETAVIQAGASPRIAHKLYNTETGGLSTTLQLGLSGITLDGAVDWDGDAPQDRPIPAAGQGWVTTVRDLALAGEGDWAGNVSLSHIVHRFSTANTFMMSEAGMTSAYMTDKRVGLSTFEMAFTFQDRPKPGDAFDVQSCIAQLGNSSIRFGHRMADAETGRVLVELSQFGVQLDLDARRPSRCADEIREKAEVLIPKG
jgi:acyl-CoA thioesterase FadM